MSSIFDLHHETEIPVQAKQVQHSLHNAKGCVGFKSVMEKPPHIPFELQLRQQKEPIKSGKNIFLLYTSM